MRVSSGPQSQAEQLVWLMVPLGVAFALGLLLLLESRRVERAHAAFSDSEQRFRMAVEAARCGIWEWDLGEDRIFMSDVTAALFGWRGGVVDGQQVLDRVSEGHRDGLREALSTAAIYAASTSPSACRAWPAAGRSGSTPAARASARAPRAASPALSASPLDVTEERLAQARAQSAETRLRDAIESVSEAFVLWDRNGRLLMSNRNYRSFFRLEPQVLKPGIEREELEALAKLAIRQEFQALGGRKGVREAELVDGRWVQISERTTAEGGLVVTAADITALKAQEEARRINEDELRPRGLQPGAQPGAALRAGPQVRAGEGPRRGGPTRPRASSWPT